MAEKMTPQGLVVGLIPEEKPQIRKPAPQQEEKKPFSGKQTVAEQKAAKRSGK